MYTFLLRLWAMFVTRVNWSLPFLRVPSKASAKWGALIRNHFRELDGNGMMEAVAESRACHLTLNWFNGLGDWRMESEVRLKDFPGRAARLTWCPRSLSHAIVLVLCVSHNKSHLICLLPITPWTADSYLWTPKWAAQDLLAIVLCACH